jgi:hypothetical protein
MFSRHKFQFDLPLWRADMLGVGAHFDNSVPWYCVEVEFGVVVLISVFWSRSH